MIWIVIALLIFIFQIATILLLEFRHPQKAVAWLLILFILPIVGFVMYYFLAKEFKRRRMVRHKSSRMSQEIKEYIAPRITTTLSEADLRNVNMHGEHRLFGLLNHLPDSPVTSCNTTTILTNGKATFDAILAAMEEAKHHIHIEYYIFRNDTIGTRVQQLMIRKAKEGVKVRFIYDGLGSYKLDGAFVEEMRKAGVEAHCFLPPFIALFDKRINYRNHRKIVVVDGLVGFLGGINIGDEYLTGGKQFTFWRDTHMKVAGDAVFFLQHTFLNDWAFVGGTKIGHLPDCYPQHRCAGNEQVQIIASGPDSHWEGILEMFFSAISSAKERIYVTSPYFIPDGSIAMALKTAAVSGVDVRIIIPEHPDTRIVYWASLSYLEELLQAGVKFYKYQIGFIHTKMLLIDRKLVSTGTANLDLRSFFSNFELNAVMFDAKSIERLEKDFFDDLQNSKQVLLSEFERRSKLQRTKEVLGRMLSPLL